METQGRQASAKAHEEVDHQTSFPSSTEEISQPGIGSPTSSLRFEYLSTITQQFRVDSDLDHDDLPFRRSLEVSLSAYTGFVRKYYCTFTKAISSRTTLEPAFIISIGICILE